MMGRFNEPLPELMAQRSAPDATVPSSQHFMGSMFHTRAGAQLLFCTKHDESSTSSGLSKLHIPAPFASISTSLIRTLGTGDSENMRKEKATGLEFPYEFCFTHKPCPQLAGLGVRSKKLLGIKNINVYAAGVYVDGTAAKKALCHKFKHTDEATLARSQELFDNVIASDMIEKTLRLVIAFGHLKRSQFVDALEERLAPPLKKEGQEAALDDFKKYFDGVNFHRGLEITFTQPAGGPLVTRIDGKEVGRSTNKALSKALWDIYLGPDPVSPDTKDSLGSTLATTLKHP